MTTGDLQTDDPRHGRAAWLAPTQDLPLPRRPVVPAARRAATRAAFASLGAANRPAGYRPVHSQAHPPATRRRLGLTQITVTLLVALTVLGAPAAVTVGRGWLRSSPAQPESVADTPVDSVIGQASAPAVVSQPQATRPADTSAARRIVLADRIQEALTRQSLALLAGNEPAFLAIGEASVQPELRRRYAVLRAMQVSGWDEKLVSGPAPLVDAANPLRWRVGVRLRYCLVVRGCTPASGTVAQSEWSEAGGKLLLTALVPSPATEMGPRPWEVTDLQVAVGARVIVAAPTALASRLPGVLAAAEKAAAVADPYARWNPPPGRYLVFLAGPDEWSRWYSVRQSPWVGAYAMRIDPGSTEIVVNAQRVTNDAVRDTLSHEFSHVVTLAGVNRDYSQKWWLTEGIAEYIRMAGRPASTYPGLTATRRYVTSGRWNGDVAITDPPTASVPADDASGRYGVAFLALRHIAERYGEEKLLAFFDATVRRGTSPADAAHTILGISWADLSADCAKSVRRAID